jgi:hypothetical protein
MISTFGQQRKNSSNQTNQDSATPEYKIGTPCLWFEQMVFYFSDVMTHGFAMNNEK